ncbi:hypothetical protein P3T37_001312 [Kitasatospora sp. MAA4]|uniref:hypothetical protein n=1 Tax=Kitasatospora sp. MAA4 TaxID=3035093 RepID=UPI002474263D|nr:hypothetical protein [Kitasatospora sp. MAA4]MDH6131938.1 hypothetical protein [Kitasatospora sp. MAA4]
MSAIELAAATPAAAIGGVSAAGVAAVLLLVMVLGVIGKGKKKLASGPAQIVGFIAETAFLKAPAFWHDIGAAFQSITDTMATNPALGGIGIGAVCLIVVVLSLFARLVPATAVFLGMLAGAAFAADPGSLPQGVVSILSIPLALLGA